MEEKKGNDTSTFVSEPLYSYTVYQVFPIVDMVS